jgi:hypothetical protein
MVEMDTLAGKVFSLLKGNGLQIKIFDAEGMETTDPTTGRRFFIAEPNIMVTIDEDSNNIEFSKGANVGNEVAQLQKNIRKLADEFLMNSAIKVFGKAIEPRDYAYQAKIKKAENMMEGFDQAQYKKYESAILSELKSVAALSVNALLNAVSPYPHQHEYVIHVLNKLRKDGFVETVGQGKDNTPLVSLTKKGLQVMETLRESFSKMFGSQRTSHQVLENVRILVKHKMPVDESVPGARTRHIAAIFLECNGERFRFPHNYLPGARAMAQHMAHGGAMGDKVGSYIAESTAHLMKLQSFNRYVTTNKLINEDSSGIVETVKENIETIRTELKKLTGVKTYETVKARIETFERQPLAEDDVSGLKDLFTIRRFDEKFEEVLPIVKQLIQEKDTYHKRIEEAAGNIVMVRRESINTTPMFEFASENARLGFKINELALRIVENDELAGFINKIGTKLCKEGQVNDFEKAVLTQVFENIKVEEKSSTERKEIKEAADLSAYFDKYDYNFM